MLQRNGLIAPTVPTAQPVAQGQIGPVAVRVAEPAAVLAVRKLESQPVAPKALPVAAAVEEGVVNAPPRKTRIRKKSPQSSRLTQ